MSQIGSFDLQLVGALAVAVILLACVMALYAIRDRRSFPPRTVTRTLWCPRYNRRAKVEFEERMVTGMLDRRVRECSIRDSGEQCDESCRSEMAASA